VDRVDGPGRPGEHVQALAGPGLVVHVGLGADPLDDDARDPHRDGTAAEPAEAAVGAQAVGARHDLGALGDRGPPRPAHLVAVGGVDGVEEAPSAVGRLALARDRAQGRRVVRGAAVGLADPHRGAGRLHQALVAGQGALALGRERVDLPARAGGGGDVDDDEPDAGDLPVRCPHRVGVEPPLLHRPAAVPEPPAQGHVGAGAAVGEHPAQHVGDQHADLAVHRLHRPAEPLVDRAAVDVEDGAVDPAEPQLAVEEDQAHRGGLPQRVQQRERLVARPGVVDLLQHADQDRLRRPGQGLGAEVQRGAALHVGGDPAAERAAGEQLVADAAGGRGVQRQAAEPVAEDPVALPAGEAFGTGVPQQHVALDGEGEHPDRQLLDHPGQQVVVLHRPP